MKDVLIILLLIILFIIPVVIVSWDIIQNFINKVFK